MRTKSHWLEELDPAESVDFYRDLALSHAEEGGRVGAIIADLIRKDKMRALCDFEIDYSDPEWTVHTLASCRQALAYFSKLEDLEIGIDKERAGLEKFLEAEAACKETNRVLRMVRSGAFCFPPRVSAVIHSARRKIDQVLGDLPQLGELNFRFGPGATRGVRKRDASVRAKVHEHISCSKELFPMAPAILGELPVLTDYHETSSYIAMYEDYFDEIGLVDVEIQTSKLAFAKKNAKTHRCVCTEPGLNVMFQLGVGTYIAKRLAAFGIDISDQTVNQRRAKEGSITGALATLDLVSASDMVAFELPYELLRLEWASFLARGRSGTVTLPDGSQLEQEKFSSMGNGFTFALETLIFWGLAAACCNDSREATVYGDDIVVPTYAFDLLVEVLTCLGFKVNRKKSYATTPFRESCGKDYFAGSDIRPIYQSRWISGQSLFVLHNSYVRRGDQGRADRVKDKIHPALLIYGPDGYGDGHLLGDWNRRRSSTMDDRGYCGYLFHTFTTKQRRDVRPLPGDYVCPSYTVYLRGDGIEGLHRPYKERLERLRYTDADLIKWGPAFRDGVYRLPIPEVEGVKAFSLPGVDGYKKISVYTLRA